MNITRMCAGLALSVLTTPVFANACMDDFDRHVWELSVEFRNCDLSLTDVKKVVNYVNSHPDIVYLDLTGNHLANAGIKPLALIQHKLTVLNLDKNELTDKSIDYIKDLSVDTLGLSENPLHTDSIKALVANPNIHGLELYDTAIDDDIARVDISGLNYLDISSDQLSAATWKALAENTHAVFFGAYGKQVNDDVAVAIGNNTFIRGLILSANAISATGYQAMFQNQQLETVVILDLKTANSFFAAAAQSHSLKTLAIISDDLLHLDGQAGKQIASIPALEYLHVLSFDVGPVMNSAFAKEIAKSRSLRSLQVFNSVGINDEFAHMLVNNQSLVTLSLEDGDISDAGAMELATMSNLKMLTLDNNRISDQGALAFLDNTSLYALDLSGNNISNAAVSKLRSSSSIKILNLENQNKAVRKRVVLSKHAILDKYLAKTLHH